MVRTGELELDMAFPLIDAVYITISMMPKAVARKDVAALAF
jgi:hypothetical protein